MIHNRVLNSPNGRKRRDSMMRERKRLLSYGLSLLAVTFLVLCGNPANPPPPKWTAENSNPSAGQSSAAAKPAPPKPEGDKDSRLEAVRRGEAAGRGPRQDLCLYFSRPDIVGKS